MSLQITSLQEEHLEDAAALVSGRYKALRERLPLLPSRYEDAATILPLLRSLTGETAGVVAIRGGRLVGFLWGFVLESFLGRRSVYSPEWANGAELEESRRVYEEMYARLSARWVADGCLLHAVTMLEHDRAGIEGWQWLGFGLAAVDGVRELKALEGLAAVVEIRQARVEDVAEVAAFGEALERHLAAAPTFWPHEPQDYEAWLRDPAHALWLAYEGGEAVECLGLEPGHTVCDVVQDEQTITVASTFTREVARGRGIATALLNRALEWAQAAGYVRCATDFEAMNVVAARFWMRWFQPVCYSLIRWIDERVGGKVTHDF